MRLRGHVSALSPDMQSLTVAVEASDGTLENIRLLLTDDTNIDHREYMTDEEGANYGTRIIDTDRGALELDADVSFQISANGKAFTPRLLTVRSH